jgi:hypothetical protein
MAAHTQFAKELRDCLTLACAGDPVSVKPPGFHGSAAAAHQALVDGIADDPANKAADGHRRQACHSAANHSPNSRTGRGQKQGRHN